MIDKENDLPNKMPFKRKSNTKNAITQEGNDYILKRYRLEQNKHFKDRANEEMKYDIKNDHPEQKQQTIQLEDDLVIVPLDLPTQNHSEKQQQLPQVEIGHHTDDMVYVFDDDLDQYQEKLDISKSFENKQTINAINKMHDISDISIKGTERSNFSTAQLMTPKPRPNILMLNNNDIKDRTKYLHGRTQKHSVKIQSKEVETGVEGIKGVQVELKQYQNQISVTIVDKKLFAISKLPSGVILRCIIKRSSSILNILSPQYDIYIANGLKHILSAKKFPMRNRQLFKFSTDPVKFVEPNMLAVMHANANHNLYWLLDLPRKIGDQDLSFIYLLIGYYKFKKTQIQRKFTALLPSTSQQYQLAIDYEQSFLNFSNFKDQIKTQLNNLQTWENQDFNSTKNFVLADQDDEEYRYLQMKKQSENVFELIIQHPLSPLQAMAIAMTRFDSQLK